MIESLPAKDQMFSKIVERLPIGRGRGRRGGAGFWLVLAVVPLLASVSGARAATATEEEQQAEALIREGVQLRGQDQTARALPLFEKAYRLARTPRTAGQLGLCELELGSYAEAELYLSEALATPNHPWIAKNRTTLKRQLDAARANVGELSLTVSPSTAEVLLDKKPTDKVGLGVPVHLRKGAVELEITAPGYQPVRQIVTIVAGKRTEHSYALVPLPLAPPAPVADSAPPSLFPRPSSPPSQASPTRGESPPGSPGVGRWWR